MTGQMNPDAKAVFLASLEYGVSPIMPADLYSKRDEGRTLDEEYREYIASGVRHPIQKLAMKRGWMP